MRLTPEMLERYYQGTSSREERASIEIWLNSREKEEVNTGNFPEEAVWQQISDAAFGHAAVVAPPIPSGSVFKRYGPRTAIAAAIIAIILVPLYYVYHGFDTHQRIIAPNTSSVRWDSIVSGAHLRKQVRLIDGTEVTLNFSSSLRFPVHFSDSLRIVYLSGEAFFKAHKDPQHSFIVKTENGSVNDLGTQFDVDAYPAQGYMAVTVKEGKVAFVAGQENKELILTKGLRGIYHYTSRKISRTEDPGTWTGWAGDTVSIPDMRMSDIALLLKKTYGLDVEISTSLSGRHFTGSFRGAALEDVARQIAFVLPCKYSLNENTLRFY